MSLPRMEGRYDLGNKSRPSFTKRQKERDRQERQKMKLERRAQRQTDSRQQPPPEPGVDADIAGIVPGPQPTPDDE